jgi:hypothetical protein
MPLRLLDYGRPNPFGETIGKPRRLAWPVNVHRVTLPKLSKEGDKLNPFERVILKLIDAGGPRDAETLAQETCLPKDLVQCVLLRLQDKGYINKDNDLIKQMRDGRSSGGNDSQEFVTACVFRELATGKILPHLHFKKYDPLKRKDEDERLYKRISYDEAYRDSPLTPHDVMAALRGMQKRSTAFGNQFHLPSIQLITIIREAELYYLDCPIAILKSDGEFRIADPFGNGFSLVLESAFSFLLEENKDLCEWLTTWKISLSSREPVNQTDHYREPYDNDANRTRYPNLISNLRLRRHQQFRSIEQIHAAIEWALFYSCVQRSYTSAVQQLKLIPQSEHPTLLQKAADTLSLGLPPGGLFPVREGKLEGFLEGKAELGTLLSLSLLMAADDASHPLRQIAAAHPDFIVRLIEIKKKRDEHAHGVDKRRSGDIELPEEDFMREVVTTLLPTVRFSNAPASIAYKETMSDALMEARTSIQTEFGFAVFNRLGSNLQDRLIVAEQFWISCKDNDNAIAFVCDLYAALQIAFRRSLAGVLPPDLSESEYVVAAQKISKACGLGDLPECLVTVKQSAIREALLGNDRTLQSCVVAFLLVSPAGVLNAIAQMHPSFISDVAYVIELRGHGNEPLPMSKENIRRLRKATYTTIKSLMEA